MGGARRFTLRDVGRSSGREAGGAADRLTRRGGTHDSIKDDGVASVCGVLEGSGEVGFGYRSGHGLLHRMVGEEATTRQTNGIE